MGTESSPELSALGTDWALVCQVHGGSPELAAAAQVELMSRYAGAVHRYLVRVVRDRNVVEELDQEFALRFVRGDFHRADPARGRFRDFVKRALRNLMVDHQRRSASRPKAMGEGLPNAVDASTAEHEFERRFVESWRAELFCRSWRALEEFEERTGQPYHLALRLRTEHPDLNSGALAALISERLGRGVSAGAVRMLLQRARGQFVAFLIDEVAESRPSMRAGDLEEELAELGLLEYCRPYLKRSQALA